jgi:type IV secretory pathway component VirB8
MKADPEDNDLDKLFAAARKAELYKTEREYGFETRVLARIRADRTENRSFLFWAWRLMPFFALLVICLTIWISFLEPSHASDLIAGAGSGYEDAVVVAYLAGE